MSQIFVCVYLRILNRSFEKTRICTSCRDTKRERPRPTPAGSGEPSKVRRVQETARREVDLSSSYLQDNSKPGLNRSPRLLSCNVWIILHVFIFIWMCVCTFYTAKPSGWLVTPMSYSKPAASPPGKQRTHLGSFQPPVTKIPEVFSGNEKLSLRNSNVR